MSMPRHLCLVAALLAAALATGVAVVRGQATVSFQDIEESLTCQCGCGLTVHSCNHLQCGSALPLREEIRQQMSAGKDKEAIIAHFRDKYGEKILSSPTAEGFNILAWVMPFVLVSVGGIVVAFTLARWRRHPAPAAPEAKAEPRIRSAYDQVVERELKNFDN